MTKGQNKALKRRALRKREKDSTLTSDKMLGNVSRRKYGAGVVSGAFGRRHIDGNLKEDIEMKEETPGQTILNAIIENRPSDVAAAFAEGIMPAVNDLLQLKKVEVAHKIFGESEEIAETRPIDFIHKMNNKAIKKGFKLSSPRAGATDADTEAMLKKAARTGDDSHDVRDRSPMSLRTGRDGNY